MTRDLPSTVLLTGASGLIGRALSAALRARGCAVRRLVRGRTMDTDAHPWDPGGGVFPAEALDGVDAVIHLAGEPLAGMRWSDAKKRRIRESRVGSTRLLATSLTARQERPAVLICASAIGYYGDRGDELLREESEAGAGFLAEVCREWEAASEPAARAHVRTIRLRLGLVLSASGGVLAQMAPLFRRGLGGRLASGQQYWSWIALSDVVSAVLHLLSDESIHGAVNLVAPEPVRQVEFVSALKEVLNRPALLAVPKWLLKMALGEMADALLLSSARVEPARLLSAGYGFRHRALAGALRHLLAGEEPTPGA